jgi:hypothetical protein
MLGVRTLCPPKESIRIALIVVDTVYHGIAMRTSNLTTEIGSSIVVMGASTGDILSILTSESIHMLETETMGS